MQATAPTTTMLRVGMTCEGCANAVTRLLLRIEGVERVVTDVRTKRVDVTHHGADVSQMLASLRAWAAPSGKLVEPW